ncbi:hypothetical protein [Algoriphagus sp.]|uniref:hypothetical protein n=1 Tax=Algoriphagus sp. TaxID=1872435 RepID=UPI003F71B2EA
MKRNLALFITIFVFSPLVLMGQEAEWDFPTKPGTQEWAELEDVHERVRACQIPEDILKNLGEQQLFELVKSYPFFLSYPFSNDALRGFRVTMTDFNGYNELLKRPGAVQLILGIYRQEDLKQISGLASSVDKGRFSLTIGAIELMLAEERLINSLSASEAMDLLRIVEEKIQAKKSLKPDFGGFGVATTSYLALSLMRSIPSARGASSFLSEGKFQVFGHRLSMVSDSELEEITQDIRQFVQSSKAQ